MDPQKDFLIAYLAVRDAIISPELLSKILRTSQQGKLVSSLLANSQLDSQAVSRLEKLIAEVAQADFMDRSSPQNRLDQIDEPVADRIGMTEAASSPSSILDSGRLGEDASVRKTAAFQGGPVDGATNGESPRPIQKRYTVDHVHAEGGLGKVWLAHDHQIERTVALKEMHVRYRSDAEARRRFLREAKITGQLEHPHIVPVYEVLGDDQSSPFYTMRFVKGKTLSEEIANYHQSRAAGKPSPVAFSALLHALVSVCHAIAYAHSRGVIHRDLKPDNILLGEFGEVVVLDWGLAKHVSEGEKRSAPDGEAEQVSSLETLDGQVMGTPGYMAPEQAAGRQEEMNHRTDIYGLGAILFAIITGKAPHRGKGLRQVLKQIVNEPTPVARNVEASAPAPLEAVCLKAMQRSAVDRYDNANQLAEEVQRYLVDEPLQSYVEPWWAKARRYAKRRRAIFPALAALVITSMVAMAINNVLLEGANSRTATALDDAKRFAASENRARREAQEVAAEMLFRRGRTLCEQGESAVGLLTFVRSIKVAPTEMTDFQRVARENIAGWARSQPPLAMILPHAMAVERIVFSPDGKRMITADALGTVYLWDAKTGANVATIKQHHQTVRAIAVRPDSNVFASASSDGTVCLWDTQTGAKIAKTIQHSSEVRDIHFSPTEKLLLTASNDTTVGLWNSETGDRVGQSMAHSMMVVRAKFFPDGKSIVTTGADGKARIWDVASQSFASPWLIQGAFIGSLAVNSLGTQIATGAEDKVCLWDAAAVKKVSAHIDTKLEKQTQIPVRGNIEYLDFSPDGAALAVAAGDSVHVFDLKTMSPRFPAIVHRGPALSAQFTPDGRWFMTCSVDNTARLWDARTGQPVTPALMHGGAVNQIALSQDGSQLATASSDKTVRVWNLRSLPTDKPVITIENQVAGLAYSPLGKSFAVTGRFLGGRLYNRADHSPISGLMAYQYMIHDLAFSPKGDRVVLAGGESWIKFYDASTGANVDGLPFETPIDAVAISHDQKWAAAAYDQLGVQFWDIESKVRVGTPIMAHPVDVSDLKFMPDDSMLVSASHDRTVRFWNTKTRKEVGEPLVHPEGVLGLDIRRDGKMIVTGCQDRATYFWDVVSRRAARAPLRQNGPIRAVRFSPDGRRVASASDDRTVIVWDVATGKPIGPAVIHEGPVRAVDVSPDGAEVLSGSVDKTIRATPLPLGIEADLDRMAIWIETMTGMELDDQDAGKALNRDAWLERCDELRTLGEPLGPLPSKIQDP